MTGKIIIFKGYNTLKTVIMQPKDKIKHSCTSMWFISEPVLMRTATLLTLENQADTWKSGLRNTVPHLPAQYSNNAHPKPS